MFTRKARTDEMCRVILVSRFGNSVANFLRLGLSRRMARTAELLSLGAKASRVAQGSEASVLGEGKEMAFVSFAGIIEISAH